MTKFKIYKSTDGQLRLDNYTATYPNNDWEQFLSETGQTNKAEKLLSMSSRERSPRIYRLRKSEAYKQWQKGKFFTITSEVYGVATANYDGRIPEASIKHAILEAVKYGEKEARYYPKSNKNKPVHERKVYVFSFQFEKV